MSIRTIDILIFLPLIPAIPIIALWPLPWERWIFNKVTNKIIGPYLIYCAFAIWYFEKTWWPILLVGSMGVAVSASALLDMRKARRLKHEREGKEKVLNDAPSWPAAEGFLLNASQSRSAKGAVKVTLSYLYKVDHEDFVGKESFTFMSVDDAERFESGCRQQKLKVHYQQDKPQVCVLDRNEVKLTGDAS